MLNKFLHAIGTVFYYLVLAFIWLEFRLDDMTIKGRLYLVNIVLWAIQITIILWIPALIIIGFSWSFIDDLRGVFGINEE